MNFLTWFRVIQDKKNPKIYWMIPISSQADKYKGIIEKKKELWKYLKKKDMRTFLKIRYGILGQTMNIPGRSGRKISSLAYSVARRIVGFN